MSVAEPHYTVGRAEPVTWIRNGKHGQPRITHPRMVPVREDGVIVKWCDTRREAEAWITAQY